MNPPAVVDTNVVVSALISGQADSPPCRILDAMLGGGFPFLLSIDLMHEYRTVLLRPKIKKLHGLTEQEVDQILTIITTNGMIREPLAAPARKANPGDQHIWNLVEHSVGTVLITGGMPLKRSRPLHNIVLSPQEFVEQFLRK